MHLFTCVFVLSEFGLKIQCFKQKMKNDMKTDKAPLLFISNDPRVTLQTIQRKKAHRDDGHPCEVNVWFTRKYRT